MSSICAGSPTSAVRTRTAREQGYVLAIAALALLPETHGREIQAFE
jgi:hypothetical protein